MNRKQRIARVLLMTLALIGAGTAHAMGSAIFIVAGAMMGSTLMFSGYMAQYERKDGRRPDGHADGEPSPGNQPPTTRESPRSDTVQSTPSHAH